VLRIKECKTHGFPICLEATLSRIFKEGAGEQLIGRIVDRLDLRNQRITSSEQVWKIYENVLLALSKTLGEDVARVIQFESGREMEAMGCSNCPLYRRAISGRRETDDNQARPPSV
jgi:hypothetical protein